MRALARKALETIQRQGKIIDHARIDATLQQIGHEYRPGLVAWTKGQSDRWARMLDIEDRINKAVLAGDGEGLNMALENYQKFMVKEGNVFSKAKEIPLFIWERGKLSQ